MNKWRAMPLIDLNLWDFKGHIFTYAHTLKYMHNCLKLINYKIFSIYDKNVRKNRIYDIYRLFEQMKML